MSINNISSGGIKAFNILSKLYLKDCTLDELLDEFSDDTLRLYINALKNNGILISSPNKNTRYYSLKEGLPVINFNRKDLQILHNIKTYFSQKSNINAVISINLFLDKISKYTNGAVKDKISKIISAKPFSIKEHDFIQELLKFIEAEKPVLIEYNSPNTKIRFFKILPICLKIENFKVYIFGIDKQIPDTRFLPVSRIQSVKEIQENFSVKGKKNFAVCNFLNYRENLNFFDRYEIINNKENHIIAKIYFDNKFHFMQKIFSCGKECIILEPENLKTEFLKKTKEIWSAHEREI